LSNFASALKEEIVRLARKELRQETETLKNASSKYRSEIAALKRRVADLEKALARAPRATKSKARPEAVPEGTPVRFSPAGLRKHRERLGLSANELGLLLDVSPQSIYNWESGTVRPRQEQIRAIAAVRVMGKREVTARLEVLKPEDKAEKAAA
jgi:DNA-binding transcriptional regulator YiaG